MKKCLIRLMKSFFQFIGLIKPLADLIGAVMERLDRFYINLIYHFKSNIGSNF